MQEGVKQVPKLAIDLMLYLVQEAGLHQGAKTHELGLAYFNKQVLLGCTPAGQEPITEQPHFQGKPSGKPVQSTSPSWKISTHKHRFQGPSRQESAKLITAWLSIDLLALIEPMKVPCAL